MGDRDGVSFMEVIDLENENLLYTPCKGTNKDNPIPVDQYDEDKLLYQVTKASLLKTKRIIDISEDDDDIREINPNQPCRYPPLMITCEICVETKPKPDFFRIKGCTHSYCSDCVSKYIASKLQDNVTSIGCPQPNCSGALLEPQQCRFILPKEIFDKWGHSICETLILGGSQAYYCPFSDCSALVINDLGGNCKRTKCPHCLKLFCVECRVAWHLKVKCEEFHMLNKGEVEKDDISMMMLAKKKKWKRCPRCKLFIEKSQGCRFMQCRCGFNFCYSCGQPGNHNQHICRPLGDLH